MALATMTLPAQADVRSYCEAYARDQADVRVSGGAILGARSRLTAVEQEEHRTLALAACLALYTPKLKIEPVTAEPETVTADPIDTAPAKQPAATPKLNLKTVTAKAAAKQKNSIPKNLTPAAAIDDPWKSFDNPLTPSRR